jgi:hypothetical protein
MVKNSGTTGGYDSNTGAYGDNAPYDGTTRSGHPYGRDAAAVGGAGALAEHEHRKHEREREMGTGTGTGIGSTTGTYGDSSTYGAHSNVPGTDAYPPPGTTIGDKLHGVERNRGVNDGMTGAGYDTTTGTGHHHLGRDAAIGAGGVGLAEHEYRKHEMERDTGVGGTYPSTTGTTTDSGIGYGANDPVHNMLAADNPADRSA